MNECRDTNCFWPMPHYQHEPDGPVYALMTKPPLLPDDDTAVDLVRRVLESMGEPEPGPSATMFVNRLRRFREGGS